MKVVVGDEVYPVEILRKRKNHHMYLRVKSGGVICVTAPLRASDEDVLKMISQYQKSLVKMIISQKKKEETKEVFSYLGKTYDVVYTNDKEVVLGDKIVFIPKGYNLDLFYKKEARHLFLKHLDDCYARFSRKIPYPSLKLRKMTTRWGVCNTKLKCVTLNTELVKYDLKYLDYVIFHELSHLIYPNHQASFWNLVEEQVPDYKKLRKEMKDF